MSTGLNVQANLHQNQFVDKEYENVNIQTQQPQTNLTTKPQYKQDNAYEQQQQDEEIDYKIDKLLPKQNQKQKLIEQNIKLKTQIYELAVQLDEILLKDKMKKKKYGMSVQDEDQNVKAKKLELKKQQLQIVEAKNKIFELKRQLDNIFNIQLVQEKEDILKHAMKKLQHVEQQKEGLLRIKKNQSKAIKTVKNQQQYKQKIDKTHKQFLRLKQETQKLKEKVLQAKKQELICHEKYVLKQQKIRELESKLASNAKNIKQKQKNTNMNKDTISNELIHELQQQVKRLEVEKIKGEKMWQQKIRMIEGELQAKRIEQERKLLILREKQKEYKLNQIRIRELRKLVKQNIAEETVKRSEDMDMSQFRHRRNIRYIEK